MKTIKQQLSALEAKRLGFKSSGTARIVLGRLKVRDRDGDLLEEDFVANPGEDVPVSVWNHSLIKEPGSARAGVGRVWVEGDEFGADIEWDDTPEGKATCARVLKERPDWSWGFPEPETRTPTKEEKAAGIKRVIVKVPVLELSPVDQGAGIAQGTLEACCGSCKSKSACSHVGAPTLEGASCKCAGSCSCGKTTPEPKSATEDDDEELVEAPDVSALDRLMLARLGAPADAKESDRDRSERIRAAISAREGEEFGIWIEDTFTDEGAVVYTRTAKDGPFFNGQLFRVSVEEDEEGNITLGEAVEVRRSTAYVPAA